MPAWLIRIASLFLVYDHTSARLSLAEAALHTTLKLRPDAGEAHLAKARYYIAKPDYDNARSELARAQATLPNDARIYGLMAGVDRGQGQNESLQNLQRAEYLDPRNFRILNIIAFRYQEMRRFPESAAVLERALGIYPTEVAARVHRAWLDLDWRADTKPLHDTFEILVNESPADAAHYGEFWLLLGLCERDSDAIARALAAWKIQINVEVLRFPQGCFEVGWPARKATRQQRPTISLPLVLKSNRQSESHRTTGRRYVCSASSMRCWDGKNKLFVKAAAPGNSVPYRKILSMVPS